jgi:dynein heavy chain
MSGLGGEKTRWGEASADLGRTFTNLTGDVLIASGVVSYMGPFTQVFRDRVVAEWIKLCGDYKIPCSDQFSLTATLGDPVCIRPRAPTRTRALTLSLSLTLTHH